ncbi:MAG: c-type cytochrome [Acidobacteria bacterium]|nr:c-type cytochrome [Acidobacteriota bacterium]
MKKKESFLTLKHIKLWTTACITILMFTALIINWRASAQILGGDAPRAMAPLRSVKVPEPSDLASYVQNKSAAIALGKALFWDMQVGSDGVQSCASCHFHAGADNRTKNKLAPGCVHCPTGPDGFSFGGPNYQLQSSDYPFHKLSDPSNRYSAVLWDRNEITSSLGVFNTNFIDILPGSAIDKTQVAYDKTFNVGGNNVRRVEPRNTPTVINAVFNYRNFWDGRAHNEFNGINPFGDSDPNARVLKNSLLGLSAVKISLKNSSLASQATGPVLSDLEMSGAGRSFPKAGKKLLSLTPLAKQAVAVDDSVLASYRATSGKGLNKSYKNLIEAAFRSEWWNSTKRVSLNANGTPAIGSSGEYSQMEYNFSMFFGLAVQLYEATLVSDQTPLDKYLEGNTSALTENQKLGKRIFEGKGNCTACHDGPEFSDATVGGVSNDRTEFMKMADGGYATYDDGFYNIGVRPTKEDLGVGNKDPFGKHLSFSRSSASGRVAVDGAFKVPQLRNVELTAPYFHNGGQFTLNQVVEFYNRGGDFHELNIGNLDPEIENLGLSAAERNAVVDFLKALTDDRVRYHQAPFDHPELIISNGHPGNNYSVTSDGKGQAVDSFFTLPAIGKRGGGYETVQTVTETRYRTETKWGITGYFLLLPIYGWVNTQIPYQVTVTKPVWTPQAPTKPFLQ